MEHCQSTQDEISKLIEKDSTQNYLVSANKQKLGRGQRSKVWFSVDNALAMSFNLNAANTMTLSSLEMGVLVSKFFEQRYDISIGLKWPNDLFIHGQKCGGILIQKSQFLICGIGLNLSHFGDYPSNIESITSVFENEVNAKTLSKELYLFISDNRLSDEKIKNEFHNRCVHMNAMVEIIEEHRTLMGKFLELGHHGEARVLIESEVKNFYSASLRVLN